LLNLGAYDVLAKPFHREELERVATSACQRWNDRHASAKTHRTAPS
jgi:FixJ family two-component response regulator